MYEVTIHLSQDGKEKSEVILSEDRIPTFTGIGESSFIYWNLSNGMVFYQTGTVKKFEVKTFVETAAQ